jgi:hypothetical protein
MKQIVLCFLNIAGLKRPWQAKKPAPLMQVQD